MADQLVSVGFGSESFASSGVKLNCFVMSGEFTRNLPSKVHKRQGVCQRFPASNHPEINGVLWLDSVLIPDGTVVMVQASHTHRAKPLKDGAIFIALRADAPVLAIKAELPVAAEATQTGSFLAFQGRGDVLSMTELKTYGIKPPRSWAEAFLDPDEVADCYEVVQLAPGAAKPIMERLKDRDGNEVLVAAKPARRIRLR